MTDPVSRRMVFQGLGALGVAVALAACAGSDDGGGSGQTLEAGTRLATTDEVPVGGGIVLGEQRVVVTQPTAGEFRAFTAVCTHQANIVTSVEDGTIQCRFHGSSFSAETGEVEGGPAPAPLAEVAIRVEGTRILAA
jgi:nitrite reductase/ring-hydroxylating ferredoxin subunit